MGQAFAIQEQLEAQDWGGEAPKLHDIFSLSVTHLPTKKALFKNYTWFGNMEPLCKTLFTNNFTIWPSG